MLALKQLSYTLPEAAKQLKQNLIKSII